MDADTKVQRLRAILTTTGMVVIAIGVPNLLLVFLEKAQTSVPLATILPSLAEVMNAHSNELFLLSVVVCEWVSPLTLLGGFWLSLVRLRTLSVLKTMTRVFVMNLLFFSLTLCMFDGVNFLQQRAHLLRDGTILTMPGVEGIITSLLRFPASLMALTMIAFLYSCISVGLALAFGSLRFLRHARVPQRRIFSFWGFYWLVSLAMFVNYLLVPYITLIIFVIGGNQGREQWREVVYFISAFLPQSLIFGGIALTSMWRYGFSRASRGMALETLSDDALSFSLTNVSE